MSDADMRIITGRRIEAALAGRHGEIMEAVRDAYRAHGAQSDSLPKASILRFTGERQNRIIALPASLGDGASCAGLKWISSWPSNTETGLERASAVILLNSTVTGRVVAVMEGSHISAKRTAASAALAAAETHRWPGPSRLGLIGCGRINFEILQFLLAAGPPVESVMVHDRSQARASAFIRRCAGLMPDLPIEGARTVRDLLGACPLVSFATTAAEPHVADLRMCPPGATILHISLRDIGPKAIIEAENLVDDIDHVCSAQTSVHLAEQAVGNRDFIRATLCDVLLGRSAARVDPRRPLVFSPFGLGTLDLALADLVMRYIGEEDALSVPEFWPDPWDTPVAAGAAGGPR